jgi:hypothetical protein
MVSVRQRLRRGCALAFVWASLVGVAAVAAASPQRPPDPAGGHGPVRGAGTMLAQVAGTPVAEFEVIWTGGLSTSQAPADDGQRQWLRGNGVTTIVNLDDRMFDVGRHGFESFLWVPLQPAAAPTDAEAERFLRFIQLRDNQPAHILSGARDARGIMVALLRYAIDGWSLADALAEGQRLNGGTALSLQQVQWLEGWAATRPPGSHRRRTGSTPADRFPSSA